jgi:polyisoprenoid-binding protein YceI
MINRHAYRSGLWPLKAAISMLCLGILTGFTQNPHLYFTETGRVKFISDAPLELIVASSDQLTGILNVDDGSFSFTIQMVSFQGFNSALQRTHFNENYIESEKYPNSTFNGKIIEDVDFISSGTRVIRAKGLLNIHGIDKDRIIRCTIHTSPGRISVETNFTVPLEDHEIKIPSIVKQKIAEVVKVNINFTMEPLE